MSFRVSGLTNAFHAVTTKATNVLFSTQAIVCKALSYIKVAEPPIAVTELPQQFNGMIDDYGFAVVCSDKQMSAFQTAKTRFVAESERKHRTSREVCLARQAWNSSKRKLGLKKDAIVRVK